MAQAELGKKWLVELLEIMGCPCDVAIEKAVSSPRAGCYLVIDHLALRPHQIQFLIGTDGVTIDAIQHLANACLNSSAGESYFYVVELNGYRQERQVALEKIATEAIAHVTATSEKYEIKHLSAAERRQVHLFFEDYPLFETYSEGKEPNRHLVVRLLSSPPNLENQ